MILAIKRASRYSPNSVEKDAAIMDAVCAGLRARGHGVRCEVETRDGGVPEGLEACISMGRMDETILRLREMKRRGVVVVNDPDGVEQCCHRLWLADALRRAGVPQPPVDGDCGYWLKRADGCAEAKGDVRYAATADERDRARAEMAADGVGGILVQAHVEGDLVKFYGVAGTGFFRAYYPGDDGESKFGDERLNGKPHHYAFDTAALHRAGEAAARAACTDVYGGDAIVGADGTLCVIDFNDWPSFSRCRAEAAEAIVEAVERKMAANK